MPHAGPGPELQAVIDRLHGMIRAAGRDPARFGVQGRIVLSQVPPPQWESTVAAWRTMRGVTHLDVHTVGLGLTSPSDHIDTLRRFKETANR
jgi:hypothetical protein